MTNPNRKDHFYRITVEELNVVQSNEEGKEHTTLQAFEFSLQDREDLFKAVENIKAGSGLEAEQATKVAVAIRLLGPLMVKDRKHLLFENFFPHLKSFIQHLKQTIKTSIEKSN